MNENFVPTSDFNTAMHALRGEIREDLSGIREEIGALRGLLQTNFDYRVKQAQDMAGMDGRIRLLEEHAGRASKLFGGISITIGGLVAWKLLELVAKK